MADINNVTLTGRLTADISLKYTQSGKAYAKFSLAVGRMKKDEADFLNCIAWEKTAEVIGEYCRKGSQVGIVGRIQTGSYDKEDGTKVRTTDIVINQLQLLGSKKTGNEEPAGTIRDEDGADDDSFPF